MRGQPALESTYREELPELSAPAAAERPPQPRLLQLNEELADELGLDAAWLRTDAGIAWLCGQAAADTRASAPGTAALAYAGHQFGQPSPVLGDGRALLLGELSTPGGELVDLHLKGSGLTPFSRQGSDGKLPLTAALRELMIGESLHALGVPSTRALAVIGTGERIQRRGPRPEPAAILVRTAASHLRYGTVQFASWHLGEDVTGRLVDYALQRHPEGEADAAGPGGGSGPAARLLRLAAERHARLVAQWMLIGFVHGVMNTDNMTLSGEAIDFGPCAFLDAYRADAVFSSIDQQGRYRFANQPTVAAWNTARLAETLLPLLSQEQAVQGSGADRCDAAAEGAELDEDAQARAIEHATALVSAMPARTQRLVLAGMAAKLGLPEPAAEEGADAGPSDHAQLIEDLLARMEAGGMDFTRTFRRLTELAHAGELSAAGALREDLGAWIDRWWDAADGQPDAARMERANPRVIPRNEHLEQALIRARAGDLQPFESLLEAVRSPARAHERYETPPPGAAVGFVTFCGT